MDKVLLLNAFSLNMLDANKGEWAKIHASPVATRYAAQVLSRANRVENSIGHVSTAAIVATELAEYGVELHPAERRTVTLGIGQEAVVAQYVGPRLPEGATELPDGAEIRWFYVVRTA